LEENKSKFRNFDVQTMNERAASTEHVLREIEREKCATGRILSVREM
jgi:hypothetical protein